MLAAKTENVVLLSFSMLERDKFIFAYSVIPMVSFCFLHCNKDVVSILFGSCLFTFGDVVHNNGAYIMYIDNIFCFCSI